MSNLILGFSLQITVHTHQSKINRILRKALKV